MAVNDRLNLASLMEEESLLEVYRSAPSFFSNAFNGWFLVSSVAILTLCTGVHLSSPYFRRELPIPFADVFAIWSNTGISLAGTILGFLIAGFAVLCTVLRPQTMIALHALIDKKYKKSRLKLLFINFVEVLVQYLTLLLVSVAVMVLGGRTGPAAIVGAYLAKVHWLIPLTILHIFFVLWAALFIMVILTLKSFVYNLYSTLLLGIADAADDYLRDPAHKQPASPQTGS